MVAIINRKKTTLQAIENLSQDSELRPYLGMSQLGHSCERYLWYSFRWCFTEEISARKLRLFSRGHREEPAIINELQKVGIEIFGEQQEVVTCHGHVMGHIDGKARNVIEAPKTIHLAEFKTMNDKSFKDTRKTGVKQSKPQYFSQCQLYMNALKLTRTLFIAVNKNDDSWYVERLEYEKDTAKYLLERAESIILSEKPLEKKFKSTWYECKWCSANEICHQNRPVEQNCRTCSNCDLLQKGRWECSLYNIPLTTSQQRVACKEYKGFI